MTIEFEALPLIVEETAPLPVSESTVMPPDTQYGGSLCGQIYSARTDATLNTAAKIYRDAFIREYIKDMNARAACMRLGVPYKNAGSRGAQLLREPYVQTRLMECLRTLQPQDVVSRGQVMARMWEEANNMTSEPAVRVAALSHLAKMLGLIEHETKAVNVNIGVMIVPVMTMDQWKSEALITQTRLKQLAAA